jgi:hypothetical protein
LDKEQWGGGWLALKRVDSGLISQEQCGGALTKNESWMVEFTRSYFVLEMEAFFHSFWVCKRGFHYLLKEKPFLFVVLGWISISLAYLMMRPDFKAMLLVP